MVEKGMVLKLGVKGRGTEGIWGGASGASFLACCIP